MSRRLQSPTLQLSICTALVFFVSVLVAASTFRIEIIARGAGRAVPEQGVHLIQSEFGGVVESIRVSNGMEVEAGQSIIELVTTDIVARIDTLQESLSRYMIIEARIALLLDVIESKPSPKNTVIETLGEQFSFVSANSPEQFVNEQKALLNAQALDVYDQVATYEAELAVGNLAIKMAESTLELGQTAISIQKERMDAINTLLVGGVESRSRYLDIFEKYDALAQRQNMLRMELNQRQREHDALRAKKRGLLSSIRAELLEEKEDLRERILDVEEQLISARRERDAKQFKSPTRGVIDNMQLSGKGAVVSEGDVLASVIPFSQNLKIDALFDNSEAGFLAVGQNVRLSFDAFPASRYGRAIGTVVELSADAVLTSNGEWKYHAMIDLDTDSPGLESLSYLKPGMTGSVDVATGDRRLISYFFAPIVDTIEQSMQER